MTETTTAPGVASRRQRRWVMTDDADRRSQLIRLGLLVLYVGVWVATMMTGALQTPFSRLHADLRSGEVRSVQLVVDDADGRDSSVNSRVRQEIVWQDGLLRRQATVVWVDSGRERTRPDGVRVVTTEPGALLEQRYGVRVERVAPSRDQSIGAWRGGPAVHQSGALQLAHVIAAMAILAYLVVGPTPWRANRWAWFWMTSVSPLASVAFLLLSGPTPGIRQPADPSRRMNGWWGFLIAFLLPGITAGLAMTASGFLDSLYF